MDRIITRLTIAIVAIYFIVSYVFAQFCVDILKYTYILLFEACVVSYTFCSGKFHCRYIRWTSLSIFIADIISHTDYYFGYIPIGICNILPLSILALGLCTSVILSFNHFYKVRKIKKIKSNNARNEQLISN